MITDKKRTNEFIADLAELAVKHFRSCVDRTRLSEENGFVSILLKNGKTDSALELTTTDTGITLNFGSVDRPIGGGREINAIFAQAAAEVLAILAGDRGVAAVYRDSRFLRGEHCAAEDAPGASGDVNAVVAGLGASGEGETVRIRFWNGSERPFPLIGETAPDSA